MPPKKKARAEDAKADAGKLPTLWQWRDDAGVWSDFIEADAALLEKTFQSKKPVVTTKAMSFSTGNEVTFDFKAMTQTNEETSKVRKIRRLAPGVWEFKDDDGGFVAFYDDDNATIETAWRAFPTGTGTFSTKALSWNAGYDSKYTFTFKSDMKSDAITGVQRNEDSGTERQLRRTQPEHSGAWDTTSYGIGGAVAPTVKDLPAALPDAGAAAIDVSILDPPDYWEKQSKPFQMFPVAEGSPEWKRVLKPFEDTLKVKSLKVHSVERIQNEALWRFYALTRFKVACRNGGDSKEACYLFHGARVRENMNAIMEYGFDLRVARDGLAGVGIYFATNSSYSNSGYVLQNPDKSKEMFVCRVALGTTSEGKHGMKRPPPKKGKKAGPDDLCDSVHRGKPPIMHVVFDNSQAYPEYLIKYTATW